MTRSMVRGLFLCCALAAAPAALAAGPASVSRDSLESMMRFLTVDPATGESRGRFVLREADITLVADSLASRLARYTGAPVDRVAFDFTETFYSGGGAFTGENIVARIEGTGEAGGVVILSAHYDAIASRTWRDPGDWQTVNAPGADDDGTGAAAVMELARVLPRHRYPFDVLCVLFSAEELGLIGSADFAARFESLYGETILGVVNLDMLGWPSNPGAATPNPVLISNYASGWLTDMIAASSAAADPSLSFRVAMPGPSNYDHGSFWARFVPAVTITEPLDERNGIVYPYYHTTRDVIESGLDFDLVETLANAAAAFLEGVTAPAGAEIALLPSDVMLKNGPYVTGSRTFSTGDSLGVLARVRNVGSGAVPPGAALHVTVTIENASGTHTLFSGEVPGPGPLESSDVTRTIMLDGSFAGGNVVRARVEVEGMADVAGNDAVDVSFGVKAPSDLILAHGMSPNPVSASFRAASLCVNLAREADLEVELFTLEGERVATGRAGARYAGSLGPGLECVSCATLFPGTSALASGIYLYRLAAYGTDGSLTRVSGRFAVAH